MMTLNHFLFCTVISVWGFQLSKRYHCVNRRSACWHLSGRAGSTDWALVYGEGHTCPLADGLRVVCKCPQAHAGLGDGQGWRTGAWHTDIPVSGEPPAAVGSRAGSGGGAPLRRMMHSRRGLRRALVNGGLSLVIHPGKPKALRWSQNIFGLSTNYHDYGSTFLSWNLKPKALSC